MSMNLHCNLIDLWQTPTYITYMCLETASPKAALKAYCHWVRDQNLNVIKTPEEHEYYNDRELDIAEHIREVESVMNLPDLEVFCV